MENDGDVEKYGHDYQALEPSSNMGAFNFLLNIKIYFYFIQIYFL